MLKTEEIDIIFLTETDTRAISSEADYQIQGYKTILPLIDPKCGLVRIIALVKENLESSIKVRSDLMSVDFPSIWIAYRLLL